MSHEKVSFLGSSHRCGVERGPAAVVAAEAWRHLLSYLASS